jgi:hypothetical protein
MKRIIIWVAATLTVLTVLITFQLNASGSSGKTGDDNGQRPAAESTVAPSGSQAPKPDGATNDQSGKPGENK